jgi:predicted nucleic acid-binding Zn ribbon protein
LAGCNVCRGEWEGALLCRSSVKVVSLCCQPQLPHVCYGVQGSSGWSKQLLSLQQMNQLKQGLQRVGPCQISAVSRTIHQWVCVQICAIVGCAVGGLGWPVTMSHRSNPGVSAGCGVCWAAALAAASHLLFASKSYSHEAWGGESACSGPSLCGSLLPLHMHMCTGCIASTGVLPQLPHIARCACARCGCALQAMLCTTSMQLQPPGRHVWCMVQAPAVSNRVCLSVQMLLVAISNPSAPDSPSKQDPL